MSLSKRLLDSVNTWKHNSRPIKATDDYFTTSCGLTLKQECEMWQWRCSGNRPKVETRVFMPQGINPVWQAGSKIHSTLPLTNNHQHGSNQLWVKRCWWKKKYRQPLESPTSPHQAPWCSHSYLFLSQKRLRDKQTNMAVLGKVTEANMPVVEATGKAQDTTASLCFPSCPQDGDMNFFLCYHSTYKHHYSLCWLSHKSPQWEL